MVSVLIWTVALIFVLCEPGAIMTSQFEEFCDELSQCDWYFLPIEMQRMYVIILSDTHIQYNYRALEMLHANEKLQKGYYYWLLTHIRNFDIPAFNTFPGMCAHTCAHVRVLSMRVENSNPAKLLQNGANLARPSAQN